MLHFKDNPPPIGTNPVVDNTKAVTSSVRTNDCGFPFSGSHTSQLAVFELTLSATPTCNAARLLALMLPSAPPVIYQTCFITKLVTPQ